MEKLRYLISAVEDNNEINEASWSDWQDALDIVGRYPAPEDCESSVSDTVIESVLERAIETNGESLAGDIRGLGI